MKSTKQIRREAGQLFRLCLVNRRLDENRVQQVVHRVVEAKRRGYLALLSHFQRLVKLEMARHRAEVESATPLARGVRERIEAGLTRSYGPTLVTAFGENPALIGGVRITVGSDVYDGSVRARLAALETRL